MGGADLIIGFLNLVFIGVNYIIYPPNTFFAVLFVILGYYTTRKGGAFHINDQQKVIER